MIWYTKFLFKAGMTVRPTLLRNQGEELKTQSQIIDITTRAGSSGAGTRLHRTSAVDDAVAAEAKGPIRNFMETLRKTVRENDKTILEEIKATWEASWAKMKPPHILMMSETRGLDRNQRKRAPQEACTCTSQFNICMWMFMQVSVHVRARAKGRG